MKRISYTRITRVPYYWKKMDEVVLERGLRLEREIFLPYRPSGEGNLTITYCPTDAMIRDFMSKLLQGSKFRKLSIDIMGLEPGDENMQQPGKAMHAEEENS